MRYFSSVTAMIKNKDGEFEPVPALRGVTSYELAKKYGYEGTEEEWVASVLGDGWMARCDGLDASKVDKTTKVNGKELTSDITLTSKDIPRLGCSYAMPSYLAFVSNTNSEAKEAAFGKNNEEYVTGIGMALAMYARWKNGGKYDIETTFDELCTKDSLSQIRETPDAWYEAVFDNDIYELIESSEYAKSILLYTADYKVVAASIGLNPNDERYTDAATFVGLEYTEILKSEHNLRKMCYCADCCEAFVEDNNVIKHVCENTTAAASFEACGDLLRPYFMNSTTVEAIEISEEEILANATNGVYNKTFDAKGIVLSAGMTSKYDSSNDNISLYIQGKSVNGSIDTVACKIRPGSNPSEYYSTFSVDCCKPVLDIRPRISMSSNDTLDSYNMSIHYTYIPCIE